MKKFNDQYLGVKSIPLDRQLALMCQKHPASVQIPYAIAQFKWCIENNKRDEAEYAAIRNFLVDVMTENSVKELEVLYEYPG